MKINEEEVINQAIEEIKKGKHHFIKIFMKSSVDISNKLMPIVEVHFDSSVSIIDVINMYISLKNTSETILEDFNIPKEIVDLYIKTLKIEKIKIQKK